MQKWHHTRVDKSSGRQSFKEQRKVSQGTSQGTAVEMDESIATARSRVEKFQQEELSALQKELLKDEVGDPDEVLRKNALQPSASTLCQTLISRKVMPS